MRLIYRYARETSSIPTTTISNDMILDCARRGLAQPKTSFSSHLQEVSTRLVMGIRHLVFVVLLAWTCALPFQPVFAYKPLSDHFLKSVPGGTDADFDIHKGAMLSPILVPRVPGTPGQAAVQEHLVNYFRNNLPKWDISWQNSTSRTPATGDRQVPFANLIFKREPPWTKPGQANYLTLVAHYDSKLKPDGFIGATDSAVPCAVLMHVAKSIDKYMTQMHDEMDALGEGGTPEMDMAVQILLTDGEEAFVSWTNTDSLYGSRYVWIARLRSCTAWPDSARAQHMLTESRKGARGGMGESTLPCQIQLQEPAGPNDALPAPRPSWLCEPQDPVVLCTDALGV